MNVTLGQFCMICGGPVPCHQHTWTGTIEPQQPLAVIEHYQRLAEQRVREIVREEIEKALKHLKDTEQP